MLNETYRSYLRLIHTIQNCSFLLKKDNSYWLCMHTLITDYLFIHNMWISIRKKIIKKKFQSICFCQSLQYDMTFISLNQPRNKWWRWWWLCLICYVVIFYEFVEDGYGWTFFLWILMYAKRKHLELLRFHHKHYL